MFKKKQKEQNIEMRGEQDGSGLAYGYADGKLVCATCGQSARSKSSLVPFEVHNGRAAGVCTRCASIIESFESLVNLAHELDGEASVIDENPLAIYCMGEPSSCEHEDCMEGGALYGSPLCKRPFGACDDHVEEVAGKVTFENRAALN